MPIIVVIGVEDASSKRSRLRLHQFVPDGRLTATNVLTRVIAAYDVTMKGICKRTHLYLPLLEKHLHFFDSAAMRVATAELMPGHIRHE